MRKLDLNHGAGRNRHELMARILLGLGIATMLLLILAVYHVNSRLVMLQAEADELREPRLEARSAPEGRMRQEQVAAAQSAMAELALPWQPLFAALESIDSPEVRLLAVEPDPRKGKLRITAEASGTNAIIEYTQALDTQPMLDEVFLLRQARKDDGPYVFNIEAVWSARS